MDEWMNGWMNGWLNEQMDDGQYCIYENYNIFVITFVYMFRLASQKQVVKQIFMQNTPDRENTWREQWNH